MILKILIHKISIEVSDINNNISNLNFYVKNNQDSPSDLDEKSIFNKIHFLQIVI